MPPKSNNSKGSVQRAPPFACKASRAGKPLAGGRGYGTGGGLEGGGSVRGCVGLFEAEVVAGRGVGIRCDGLLRRYNCSAGGRGDAGA